MTVPWSSLGVGAVRTFWWRRGGGDDGGGGDGISGGRCQLVVELGGRGVVVTAAVKEQLSVHPLPSIPAAAHRESAPWTLTWTHTWRGGGDADGGERTTEHYGGETNRHVRGTTVTAGASVGAGAGAGAGAGGAALANGRRGRPRHGGGAVGAACTPNRPGAGASADARAGARAGTRARGVGWRRAVSSGVGTVASVRV